MSFILLTLFVWGVSVVINTTLEFFNVDIDRLYNTQRKLVQALLKPTVYCNVCMSSVWGTICYFGIFQFSDWRYWILHCVVAAGLIFIMNRVIEE